MTKISTNDQVSIVKIMLELGDQAEIRKDASTLAKLSKLASILLPYANETDVTMFYDLGEGLFESSVDITSTRPESESPTAEILEQLSKSLIFARNLASLPRLTTPQIVKRCDRSITTQASRRRRR